MSGLENIWVSAKRRLAPVRDRLYKSVLALRSDFRGTYVSFEDARRSSATKEVGYDNPKAATLYINSIGRMKPSDYPVLHWLTPLLRDDLFVADVGGNLALSYLALTRYISFPVSAKWLICDVPEAALAGERIRRDRKLPNVSFTSRLSECDGADFVLCSGALQYLPFDLTEKLTNFQKRPPHVLLNRTPVHDSQQFITRQNIGPAICPYRVFDRSLLLRSCSALSYELIDSWTCPELSCIIPFHPDKQVPAYSGFYFRLT